MRTVLITLVAALSVAPALAQDQPAGMEGVLSSDSMQAGHDHSMGMGHESMMHMQGAPVQEPGQGAFAAIGEIVAALEADPATDWSKVDIDALRAHLRDMNLVVIGAEAGVGEIPGGLRFEVTGEGPVIGAVQRMVLAHAGVMQGVDGWTYEAQASAAGATLDVLVPEADMAKLRALGFFGILTSGMHHQAHHWMIATGTNPH